MEFEYTPEPMEAEYEPEGMLLEEKMEYKKTKPYYKDTPEYRRMLAIIKSKASNLRKMKRLSALFGTIYSAEIPETWILHEAIKNDDTMTIEGLLGMYGSDIVAKLGRHGDTLPLAIEYGNPEIISLIEDNGGKIFGEAGLETR